MLKWFYDLRTEIFTFLEMKAIEVPELINDDGVRDLPFLLDLTAYLSELNLKLQNENQLVNQLCIHVKSSRPLGNSTSELQQIPFATCLTT
jgi:hypothetical protein